MMDKLPNRADKKNHKEYSTYESTQFDMCRSGPFHPYHPGVNTLGHLTP
jgi:hypothetical protein